MKNNSQETNNVVLHHSSDYLIQPWKNGQGTTTEITKGTISGEKNGFDWRLSVAEIQNDGPFSEFAEIDRTLMLLEGNGIELVDKEPIMPPSSNTLADPFSYFSFDGSTPIFCKLLDGPTTDFNVMTKQGAIIHKFDTLVNMKRQYRINSDSQILFIFCIAADVTIMVSGKNYKLNTSDTLEVRVEEDTPIFVSPTVGAACAIIRLEYQ